MRYTRVLAFPSANQCATVRHDRIGELRASGGPCSPEEWESILKSLLLGGEPIEGIEAGAEANVGKSVTITIRRRVAGINVSLSVCENADLQLTLLPSNDLAP
jgi:hypothetical protein